MTSKSSIFRTFVAAAALMGAAVNVNAVGGNEPAAAVQSSEANSNSNSHSASGAAVGIHAAVFAAGTSAMGSGNNAMAFGQAAADSEEAIPASNLAVMFLAAVAAMGLVVVRRSGSR